MELETGTGGMAAPRECGGDGQPAAVGSLPNVDPTSHPSDESPAVDVGEEEEEEMMNEPSRSRRGDTNAAVDRTSSASLGSNQAGAEKAAVDVPLISKADLMPINVRQDRKEPDAEEADDDDDSSAIRKARSNPLSNPAARQPEAFDQPPPLPHKKNKSVGGGGGGVGLGTEYRKSNGSGGGGGGTIALDQGIMAGGADGTTTNGGEVDPKKPLVDAIQVPSPQSADGGPEPKSSAAVPDGGRVPAAAPPKGASFWSRIFAFRRRRSSESKESDETDIEALDAQSSSNASMKKGSGSSDITMPMDGPEGKCGGAAAKSSIEKELTPTHELFRVQKYPYFKYIFSFAIFALVLLLFALGVVFMYPEIFDLRYLHMVAKHGYVERITPKLENQTVPLFGAGGGELELERNTTTQLESQTVPFFETGTTVPFFETGKTVPFIEIGTELELERNSTELN